MLIQIDILQQLLNRLGAHIGFEFVAILLQRINKHFIRQQITLVEGGHARIGNDERFEIQDTFDIAQRHVQQQADP
jgi:hypothetical protein